MSVCPWTTSHNRQRSPAHERHDETVSEVFARSPEVAAVLISHAHADHTGLLHLVPPGVPIFLSKGTSKMMLAGSVYANQPNVPRDRQRVLELRSPHRIGDITVTAFPVDHSAFDAQAFLLEADGQRVLYSGDLRLHGRKPGMAHTLLDALSEKPVDALVMEGTHFSEDRQPGLTEVELEDAYLRGRPLRAGSCASGVLTHACGPAGHVLQGSPASRTHFRRGPLRRLRVLPGVYPGSYP